MLKRSFSALKIATFSAAIRACARASSHSCSLIWARSRQRRAAAVSAALFIDGRTESALGGHPRTPGSPSSAAVNQPERASVELGGKRKGSGHLIGRPLLGADLPNDATGVAPANTPAVTSRVTTLPAPITVPDPIVTPGRINAPAPTHTSDPISTGFPYSCFRRRAASRGCMGVRTCTAGPKSV